MTCFFLNMSYEYIWVDFTFQSCPYIFFLFIQLSFLPLELHSLDYCVNTYNTNESPENWVKFWLEANSDKQEV